jgi:hypothetical protein
MSRFNGNEDTGTGRADLPPSLQAGLDGDPILTRFTDMSRELNGTVHRRRAAQLDAKFSRDGARWNRGFSRQHEMMGSSPVGVAIQKRPNDATAEHAGERLMFGAWLPGGDNLISIHVAIDAQALAVGRAAAETDAAGGEALLQAGSLHAPSLVHHEPLPRHPAYG